MNFATHPFAKAVRAWGGTDAVNAERAFDRVGAALRAWRDARDDVEADPLFDDTPAPYHTADVAALFAECQRLQRLETLLLDALTTEDGRCAKLI